MRDYVVGDYSDIQQKLWLSAKISNQLSWNFNIKEVEDNIKMIKYTPGDFYTWHSDFNAGSSSTRKLVTIVQLTDPSEYARPTDYGILYNATRKGNIGYFFTNIFSQSNSCYKRNKILFTRIYIRRYFCIKM